MAIYLVSFQYGKETLKYSVEAEELQIDDRRGFADMARNAMFVALDSIPESERIHAAHDFEIYKVLDFHSNQYEFLYAFPSLS